MPGEIVNVAFLSQMEDMDIYLKDYRSRKSTSKTSYGSTYVQSSGNQGRFNNDGIIRHNGYRNNHSYKYDSHNEHGMSGSQYDNMMHNNSNSNSDNSDNNNNNKSNNSNNSNKNKGNLGSGEIYNNWVGNDGYNIKKGNYGEQGYANYSNLNFKVTSDSNNSNNDNTSRNKDISKNDNDSLKNGGKNASNNPYIQNTNLATHFKKTYSPMYYNNTRNDSTGSLTKMNPMFFGSSENSDFQSTSKLVGNTTTLMNSSINNSLAGGSSFSSNNFDYMFQNHSDLKNNLSSANVAAPTPYSNYLGNSILPNSSVSASMGNNPLALSTNLDLMSGLSTPNMINEFQKTLSFTSISPLKVSQNDALPTQHGTENKETSNTGEKGKTNPEVEPPSSISNSNMMLMDDSSFLWGSSNADLSSSTSVNGTFGIWNNDMSVWS
ncbi:hypothetical protein TPHA_0E00780 [Tetrapisispora phaffii CBS 4417]|uniref:Uncharacterized protein n=1 Tax=Tetrapisispora phaffii (strain ATCC 24235 / CBS 4417 / NBRC 1672 / NRRL Y-8282 / UCD 70-5) TaxID=1071381 RepID=G8BTE5_TETPH|nr:hypothetical protein TPHA_0E00780 [Tetrapisispora phaffii CBS 4417]CCE63173.1 hypothetical protein TPHA_0E00780 [Tetrapisispora phaffii CBS 4417]